jgi:energy-coupling factor transporter ATP-binding protein EcfA2
VNVVAAAIHRPADNPFASHRIEGLVYRQDGTTLQDLRQRLEELGGRVAIVGPEGSGKTTLLEEIARDLGPPRTMVRIPGSCPRPWRTVRAQLSQPVSPRHAVLVDGSEQLGAVEWRRLLHRTRRARYLIVTVHRPGRLPTLIECRTDASLLRDLVEELAPADAATLESSLDELFRRHGGNIRLCLRELYDVYAGRVSSELRVES